MHVLKETALVLCIGVTAGVGVGAVRGFPEPGPVESATTTCTGPVPNRPAIGWIPLGEARSAWGQPTVTFVDARPHDQFVSGHISGALNVPVTGAAQTPEVVALLRGSSLVVCYCDTSSSCASSTRLASDLASAGLANVRVLEGGFPAWVAAGNPAEAGTCPLCPAEPVGSVGPADSADSTDSADSAEPVGPAE